jgi:phosphoglycolate phosphatase-like HAD superfamily hydrolase
MNEESEQHRNRGLVGMRPHPEAVVFDLDGTLVNSRIDFERMKMTIIKRFERVGIPPHKLSTERTVSENMRIAREYFTTKGMEDILEGIEAEIELELVGIERQALDDLNEIAGAARVLAWMSNRGIRLGVLTRGSRNYARDALKKTSLNGYISEMVCRDDYPWWEAKPNGISLLRLLSRLGVPPDRSMFVGDHRMDLECARETGVSFVAVLSGSFHLEDWSFLGDFPVIESVDMIPELLDGSRFNYGSG